MLFTKFRSRDPLNHLPRILGQLERMGFVLEAIHLRARSSGFSDVRILYRIAGNLSSQTFVERIAQLPGIDSFRHGTVS